MKRLMMVAAAAALVSGCVTNYKNDGGEADLKPRIVRDIAYEKYEISDKPVTASEQIVGILPAGAWNMFTVGGMSQHLADDVVQQGYTQTSITRAKSGAYALACEKAGCDSLVGTRYTVVYKWYFLWNEATVTVTGYPAKLTGVEFHKAKLD
ncbi:MAG: hypothetical protein J6334_01140 [Kiritimatiellae bacterium]|nr:hypothetical protein [Kiritimatiellia bacterium]